MRTATILWMGLMAAGALAPGHARAIDCSAATVPQPLPVRPTVLAPVSPELPAGTSQLGAPGGVLAQAHDEALSVDQVLLRLRIEGCQDVAMAMPAPTAVDPLDPAVYKKQTEFDNTPWRFDMSQNGKRMTADEFSAWMKSRGVRVAKGKAPAAPATTPDIAEVPGATAPPVAPAPSGESAAPPAVTPSGPRKCPQSHRQRRLTFQQARHQWTMAKPTEHPDRTGGSRHRCERPPSCDTTHRVTRCCVAGRTDIPRGPAQGVW